MYFFSPSSVPPSELRDLSPNELNDFTEVGNIGAGRACARLSELIHRRCVISVPTIDYFNAVDMKTRLRTQAPQLVAIFTRIHGEIPSWMCMLIEEKHCRVLVRYLIRGGKDVDFSDRDSVFALKQTGDHVAWAHARALRQFLKAHTMHSMPDMVLDNSPQVIDHIVDKFGLGDDRQLVIHTSFFDPEKTFEGGYFFIMDKSAQWVLSKKLQLLLPH